MNTDAVILFFALLAVAAEVGAALLVWLAAASRVSRGVAAVRHEITEAIGPQAFALGLIVATVATGGSLYLSEVAGFEPCRLCWYQRFAMYPLVPVLAIVAWRPWFPVRWAVLAVALVGGSISTWHVLVQRFPTLETGACDPTNPCTLMWVNRFGYLTIPTMALSGFALIAMLMLTARPATID